MSTRKRYVRVRPYVPPGFTFMGFENYGQVLFEGCKQKEYLAYYTINGVKRYKTGLDEFAPYVKELPENVRIQKVREIKEEVARLEKELAFNTINTKDPDFWDKVKLLRADNEAFWKEMYIELSNEGLILDLENPKDRLLYHAIKAGGFSLIAPSYKEAGNNAKKYLFYLDSDDDKMSDELAEKKIKNKALALLSKMEEENRFDELLSIAKILLENGIKYTKDYRLGELYNSLDEYLGRPGDIINKCERFIALANMDVKELKVMAILSDLLYLKKVYYRDLDRMYYCTYTNSFLGKNMEEMVKYLLMPENKNVLIRIIENYRNDLAEIGYIVEEDKRLVLDDDGSGNSEHKKSVK